MPKKLDAATALAILIDERLAELGHNAAWLAAQCEVSDNAVSNWRRRGAISRDNAIRVAVALSLTVDQVYNPGTPSMTPAIDGMALMYVTNYEAALLSAFRESDETGKRMFDAIMHAAPRASGAKKR